MTTSLTVGQITILTNEITNDPLHRGYASMTDATVAGDLNSIYRTMTVDMPVSSLRQYIYMYGIWPVLAACAANTAGNPAAAGTAATIIQAIAPGAFGVLETSKASVYSAVSNMTTAMVTANVISQMQAAQIMALASGPVSRAAELALPPVAHQDIAWIRGVR